MAHLVQNEQRKLLAGALDRISTVCVAVGVAPVLTATLLGAAIMQTPDNRLLLASTVFWICIAVTLHLAARHVLKGLRE